MVRKKCTYSWSTSLPAPNTFICYFYPMQIPPGKKIYFLSDFHLGAPDHSKSLEREKEIVRFLKDAEKDANQIFIVGDLFDFWYEYKTVIPKGYTRLLGKLAEITDKGIQVTFFVGNHDMWMKNY